MTLNCDLHKASRSLPTLRSDRERLVGPEVVISRMWEVTAGFSPLLPFHHIEG